MAVREMTDPHPTVDFDSNVTYTFPAIFVPPVPGTTTNHHRAAPTVTVISGREAGPADATNNHPSPDTRPISIAPNSEYQTAPAPGTDPQHLLVISPYDAPTAADLALDAVKSRSQSRLACPGSLLDLASHPLYEPVGELLHENVPVLDEFNTSFFPRVSAAFRSPLTNTPPSAPNPVNSAAAPDDRSSVAAFVPPLPPRSALKRKASASPNLYKSPRVSFGWEAGLGLDSTIGNSRTVTFERMSGVGPASPDDEPASSELLAGSRASLSAGDASINPRIRVSSAPTPQASLNVPPASSQGSTRNRGTRSASGHPPSILPPEKVFPIQIGTDLFRLSGASISSDAPSYFTQFFEEQIRQNEESGGVRTLYIDRDPATFRDVVRHLQGYYVKPVDGSHFVKLFADAQFYSLPRLINQLFESEIFIQIGERHFQIPKDIFSEPGNSPNFFSLGFAVFFSSPDEVFPGLDRRGLLRPPSITPPCVPGRSSEIFAELLHLLRGYPLRIKNETHRAELLRDCRYFHLRGLEQRLIAHEISHNLERHRHEICLRLEDVKPSGVSYHGDESAGDKSVVGGWVYYARPFVDDISYELVLEIGGEYTVLDLTDMRADFHGLTKARVSSLFQVVANKMNLPTNAPLGLMMLSGGPASQSASPGHTPLSEDLVKVRFEAATDITLDGERYEIDWESPLGQVMSQGPAVPPSRSESESDMMSETTTSRPAASTASGRQRHPPMRQAQVGKVGTPSQGAGSRGSVPLAPIAPVRASVPSTKKRKRQSIQGDLGEWTIRTGQWRLRVQPIMQEGTRAGFEIIFIGVKIDAYSNERARNTRRGFLS